MGGASLGNLFGSSTAGSNANAPAGTTPGLIGSSGKFEAFNPTAQADAWAPSAGPNMANFATAGLDATSGLPTYVTNWLSSGGQGTLTPPTAVAGGAATTSDALLAPKQNETWTPPKVVTPNKATTTTTASGIATPASASGVAGLKQVGGNQYAQPLYVNDQWNFGTGTSQPMATPALGGPAANQGGQAPFWTDSKGNYFFDAAGTKPVTGAVVQQLRNMWG